MAKKIIITGVSGQDGSHMVDYLLDHVQDCIIYGGMRRVSVRNNINIAHIRDPRFQLFDFDLTDPHTIYTAVDIINPDYFINFAAQSFVAGSWMFPWQTFTTDASAVLTILEVLRQRCPHCRFYNAGSSEEFGDIIYQPQNEAHPLRPRSPYAAGKASARHIVKVYRDSYDLYAVQGWLFNHEGTRRGEDFVTRKISLNTARIRHQLDQGIPAEAIEPLSLGNLDARRDWSDAEHFMPGIWLMLNQQQSISQLGEYVLASGETHSVRDFLVEAFAVIGLEAFDTDGALSPFVHINPDLFRPAEVDALRGDASRAKAELGWSPRGEFRDLVHKMVRHDLDNRREQPTRSWPRYAKLTQGSKHD